MGSLKAKLLYSHASISRAFLGLSATEMSRIEVIITCNHNSNTDAMHFFTVIIYVFIYKSYFNRLQMIPHCCN